MSERPDISIIGAGKVGTALGVLAAKCGLRVVAVADRDASAAEATAKRISVKAVGVVEAAGAADMVLLTVSDDAIEALCRELSAAKAFRTGAIVAHCSGALGSEILSSARESCGCRVASMHPLQTFPTANAAVEKLPGAYFFCEGDDASVAAVMQLAETLGGIPQRIDPSAKALYHAAAAMACNYLAVLMDAALKLTSAAGISPRTASEALAPLVRATVENILAMGPAGALTGPIARGDAETVRRHAEVIAKLDDRGLSLVYSAMGTYAAQMALGRGAIDEESLLKIFDALWQGGLPGRGAK